jgi:sulfur carrier protein ThiS
MNVYIEKEDKQLVLKTDNTNNNIKELLKVLKINPSTVIIVKNDEIVLEEESLEDNDEVKILSVISGG